MTDMMTRDGHAPHDHTTPVPAAISLISEQHAQHLYTYALRRVRQPVDADDIVAETFRRLVEHPAYDEQRPLPCAAWLYRVARNLIIEQYRRPAPLPLDGVAGTAVEQVDPGPEQVLFRGERRHAVRAALAALSPAQRKVLWLRYGCELRYREIGGAVGQSEGTIKQVAHRARGTVRRHLATTENAGLPAARLG